MFSALTLMVTEAPMKISTKKIRNMSTRKNFTWEVDFLTKHIRELLSAKIDDKLVAVRRSKHGIFSQCNSVKEQL